MSKFKRYFFIVILAATCLIASPFIYSQIWKNSSIVFKAEPPKSDTPVVNGDSPSVPELPTATTQATHDASVPDNIVPGITSAVPPGVPEITEENGSEPVPDDTAVEDEQDPQRKIIFGESGSEYFDDALFIGDSRMVGIRDYGTIKNADYFCSVGLASWKIDSEVIDGRSFADVLSAKQYGKIYVMVGINEVANAPEYIMSTYKKMTDAIRERQPDAVIYLMANLHVSSAKSGEGYITNPMIDTLNANIMALAEEYADRTYYIDVNGDFEDESGCLISDYTSDGVHIYAKQYSDWCSGIAKNTVVSDSLYPGDTVFMPNGAE